MKKTILFFVVWLVLADFANHTDCKILMLISCVLGIFMIVYIVKNNAKNE